MTLTAARLRHLDGLLAELADDPDVSLRLWPHIGAIREFTALLAATRDALAFSLGVWALIGWAVLS